MAKRKPAENAVEETASFEESLGELQSIVSDLEDGTLGLEASLARFERGINLLRTCYTVLEAAEAKVEILTRFNGNQPPTTVPFDATATLESARVDIVIEKSVETSGLGGNGASSAQSDSDPSSLF